MGTAGDTEGPTAEQAAAALLDELTGLGDAEVSARKMSGGFGVYADDIMFAMVDSTGTSLLRTGDDNRNDFDTYGSEEHEELPYHQVPPNILGNRGELRAWAMRSLAVARADRA
jgi:TfoX/Sxy family transcriptional regulator of competence genes